MSVVCVVAPGAGGNMLSIIPDTPRGQARGENGRNISLVLLQLYFMIYNETT